MDGAEAIELARGLLPAWVGWVNFLLPIALAFLVSLVSTWSAGTVALRLVGDRPCENWADRARRDFPVRRAIALCLVAISLGIGAMGSWFQGPLSPLPGAVSLWLVLTPAYGGGMLVFRRFSRRLGDGSLSPPDSWWRNFAVGLLVFVPSWLVTALVMTSIGNRPDARAVMTLAAGAIATGFFALGGGLLVLRRLGLAAPPSPRLAAIVEEVSRRVGVQPRTTYEVRTSMANAFVFPASGVLAFTERALGVLDDDEVAAICAHELGHLAEPRLLHVIRCLEPYLLLPLGALPLVMTSFGARGTAAMVGAIIIASFACRRFRRGREERADRVAHAHQGEAGVYAHALERLYRANRIPAVVGRRRGSHPELYDRMAAAAAAPPYPRPLPPPTFPHASTAPGTISPVGSGMSPSTVKARPSCTNSPWHAGRRGITWMPSRSTAAQLPWRGARCSMRPTSPSRSRKTGSATRQRVQPRPPASGFAGVPTATGSAR